MLKELIQELNQADEGKKITNGNKSFFSDFIYLGKNDSPDNYEEVGRYIWGNYVKDTENSDIIEAGVKELESKLYMLQDCLLDIDFRLTLLQIKQEFI